jgi:DNA-directed RNA polymerase subunit RPC12/RpoP
MPMISTFVCECGIRFNIITDPQQLHESTVIPCPSCKTRHIVKGHVVQVFTVSKDGVSQPYDWKAALPPELP